MAKKTPTITPTPPIAPSAEALNAVKLGYVPDVQTYENSVNTGKNLAANNIKATDLNATPYTVPTPTPKTGYAGLIESSNAAITGMTPSVVQGEKDIKSVYDKLGGQSSKKAGLYDSEGIYTKQKAYNELVNTINAKDLAYRRKVEKIRNENPTGQLAAGQSIATDKVEKDWASEKADLSIAAAFARDDYTTAKQIVDDKISAETEDLTTQLEGLKFFYTQNAGKLSDAQKTLLQQQTNQVETELADKKQRLAEIGNIQLEAAANGAPASVISLIGKAGDTTEAITSAGRYIGLYDRMKANSSINGSGNGIKYTDTQVSNGASAAGVPLSTFQGYDQDTQNFFITGDIAGSKKSIDDEIANGASIDDIKSTIRGMTNVPVQGQNYLIQYADKSAIDNAPLTPEQTTQTIVSSLKSLQTSGYSRAEAQDAVTSQLSDSGKTKLTKSLNNSVKDALTSVYGKTFWQKVLPGGR